MLAMTFNELTDPECVRIQLNHLLRKKGKPEIAAIEFDGCEDINVKLDNGATVQICAETTMQELFDTISSGE